MPTAPESKHVLVVNDSDEIVELFRGIVEGMGHRVSSTTFGQDDLADVRRIRPDLVILDMVVDDERRGWQLVQKLRMARDTEGVRILVCSAPTTNVREQEGWLAANGVGLLAKPFLAGDLEVAVTKAFERPLTLAPPTGSRSDPNYWPSRPKQT